LTARERAKAEKQFVIDNPIPGERPEHRRARVLEAYMEYLCFRALILCGFSEAGYERFGVVVEQGVLDIPGPADFERGINWAKAIVMGDESSSEQFKMTRFHTLHMALNDVNRLARGER
jgi:hypothetical protein